MIGDTTLHIITRTPTGDYGPLGTPTITETTTTVTGCSLQIDTATETHGTTSVVTLTATAYLPVTPDTKNIGPNDAIHHDNRTWEMQGPAITVRDLTTDHHIRCELKWQAS